MKQTHNKLTKPLNRFKTDKKPIISGGIVVFFIALTPFMFYMYESFPRTNSWETSLFTWKTSFPDWYSFAWYFSGKFIPLFLLLLWFFTCKHWWHWIILVPIAMYSFQLWGVLNESNNLDSLELYYIIPLMLVVVPSVYLIRAKLFARIRGNDLASFEAELGTKRSIWEQIKDLFR